MVTHCFYSRLTIHWDQNSQKPALQNHLHAMPSLFVYLHRDFVFPAAPYVKGTCLIPDTQTPKQIR